LAVSAQLARDDSGSLLRSGAIQVIYDDRDRIPLTREGEYLQCTWRGMVLRGTDDRRYGIVQVEGAMTRRLNHRLSWEPVIRAGALMPWDLPYARRERFTSGGEWLSGYWPRSVLATRYVLGTLILKYFWDNTTMGGLFADMAWMRGDSSISDMENFLGDYGVSLEQNRRGIGLVLRCGWKRGADWRDGLLSFGLLNRF